MSSCDRVLRRIINSSCDRVLLSSIIVFVTKDLCCLLVVVTKHDGVLVRAPLALYKPEV